MLTEWTRRSILLTLRLVFLNADRMDSSIYTVNTETGVSFSASTVESRTLCIRAEAGGGTANIRKTIEQEQNDAVNIIGHRDISRIPALWQRLYILHRRSE
jgi:hypothetical protein